MGEASLPRKLKSWLPIVHKSLEGGSTTWQEEWNSIVASFHDAFSGTPEDEVARDLDETLAEVRRSSNLNIGGAFTG